MSYRFEMARLCVAGIAMLASGSGCFYFRSINSEPDAKLERNSDSPHVRGGQLSFSAGNSTDPDGQPLEFEWTARTCNADRTACDPPLTGVPTSGPNFAITIPSFRAGRTLPTESVLVTLVARDPDGAEDQVQEFVDVFNRNPTLELQVQGFESPTGGGFPIGTSMNILALGADEDGDQVSYQWRYYAARGSDPEQVNFEPVNATTYRLTPDLVGQWIVEVTATDGVGGTAVEDTAILVQEDAPPCIGTTVPEAIAGARYILDRNAEPRRFSVLSVTDDLDIYPPPSPDDAPQGRARFRWLVATPDTGGELVEIQSHDVAEYLLDVSAYAPGDAVSVRVEIDDRQGRQLGCASDQATCSIDADACLQRVTWEGQVR